MLCNDIITVPSNFPPLNLQSPTPTTVLISWLAPNFPNGNLLLYQLQRLQPPSAVISIIANVSVLASQQYVDSSTILRPFTSYQYRLGAMTSAGWGFGEWINVTTKPSC